MPGDSPQFISDQIGNDDDAVDLQVGDDDPVIVRKYTIDEAILKQPADWTLDVGHGTNALQLFQRYSIGTKYVLRIHGVPQLTGFLDRRKLSIKRGASGTSLVLSGRDTLGGVHTATCAAAESFNDTTYATMVSRVLTAVGLDPSKLVKSNTANRSAKAGVPVRELKPPVSVDGSSSIAGTIGATAQQLQANFGESWLTFLRRHLDRAGLMLWAAGDGGFVLTAPNPNLAPTYQIYRDLNRNVANILDSEVDDDATHRHTEAFVGGRGGGKKKGSVKSLGSYVDQEMLDYLAISAGKTPPGMQDAGYDRPLAIEDRNAQTAAAAGFLARRRIAEERRDGWRFNYTISGHTLPVAGGNGSQRAVITTDTIVQVTDLLLGIDGLFYIESVKRSRDPQTETVVRLMRPQDLVFGDPTPAAHGITKPRQQPQADGGPPLPLYDYFGSGVAPPPTAVGQDAAGRYIDASGNVIQ